MTNTTARIKRNGMNFEVLVDMESALKFKKGETDFFQPEIDRVFLDIKKGNVAGKDDLEIAFKTTDPNEIAKIIVKQGEILVNQEYREEERERKIKQVVDFLSKNAIDPRSGKPISPERIKNALNEAHVQLKNVPMENQITEIVEALSKVIPIKIETKKVRVTVPAIHTGRVYGFLTQYKEKEEWLDNGDLQMIVNVPAGLILDFYDKLNSTTSGSALISEVKD